MTWQEANFAQAPAATQLAQPAPTCLFPVMPRNSHLGFPCFYSFKKERRHLVFLHSFGCCKSFLGKSFGSLAAHASAMAKLNLRSAVVGVNCNYSSLPRRAATMSPPQSNPKTRVARLHKWENWPSNRATFFTAEKKFLLSSSFDS